MTLMCHRECVHMLFFGTWCLFLLYSMVCYFCFGCLPALVSPEINIFPEKMVVVPQTCLGKHKRAGVKERGSFIINYNSIPVKRKRSVNR